MYGAESVILNLARTLNSNGNQCLLAIFANSANENHELHEIAVKHGIKTFLVPCTGRVDRKAISCIRALIRETGAEVVHCHGYKADIYAYLALRNHGIPLISTCHNWLDTDFLVYAYGVLDRLVLKRFARVVAVSDAVRQRLLRHNVPSCRIEFIRNGIETAPFALVQKISSFETSEPPVVGLVGRLGKEKGIDVFLEAAACVRSEVPFAKFIVVGDGPDRKKLQNLIDTLGIAASVSMVGRREDMPAVYRSFDIMVSSSRQEGLPMAILEAMACGLPLIATAVGEVPSVVRDGETGILVSPDDPQILASAILDLLRDSEKRRLLGSAARQLIMTEYSAERMANEYVLVYREAIAVKTKGFALPNAS
jgi:glycosyltransferase involved in cell wall biosynthesis